MKGSHQHKLCQDKLKANSHDHWFCSCKMIVYVYMHKRMVGSNHQSGQLLLLVENMIGPET